MTQRIITIDTTLGIYADNPTKKRGVDRINYRELKKELNKFFNFGFKMPRKGQDFSPQQKTVLRKRLKEVKDYIGKSGELKENEVSFIRYPKRGKNKDLKNIDAKRTNKGIFYKYPNAKIKFNKKEKVNQLVIIPRGRKGTTETVLEQRREILYPFPESIRNDPEKIRAFVEALRGKYKPDDIRFSTENARATVAYDNRFFDFYFDLLPYDEPEEVDDQLIQDYDDQGTPLSVAEVWKARKYRETSEARPNFYNGVFLIYYVRVGKKRKKPL